MSRFRATGKNLEKNTKCHLMISQNITDFRELHTIKRKILNKLNAGRLPISRAPHAAGLRRWSDAEISLVLQIRRANPTYGKSKITTVLKRDHDFKMSESTVGRTINYLKDKKIIQRSISAQRTKRKRNFNKHANLLKFKKYEDTVIGGRVQIDHMTVTKNGIRFKCFQAWELKMPLDVLPSATPKYNGGVERANKTLREEFYVNPNLNADSLGEMRFELQKTIKKYNEYRQHSALNGLAPLQYIRDHSETTSPSRPVWTCTSFFRSSCFFYFLSI